MRISKRGDSLRRVENVEQQMVVRRMHRGWRKERKKSYKTRAVKDEYKCATAKPSMPSDCFYTSYTLIRRCNTGEKEAFCSQIPGRSEGPREDISRSLGSSSRIECNSPPAPLISQSIDFNRLHPPRSLDLARLSRCRRYRIRCIVGHRGSEINRIEQGETR